MAGPRRTFGALCLASLLLLGAGIPVRAELTQKGDLIASFEGDLFPKALPREHAVPVGVRVAGNVRSASGEPASLPQLRRITVAINRAGRLFDRGLPVCEVGSIQPATEREAHRVCGDAIVGSGHVVVLVRIPAQPPFFVRARLLAFKGPRRNGRKLILAQVYATNPPGSFILTFEMRRGRGTFGTSLSTTLPPSAESWAYLTHFDMTLRRVYTYGGRSRSYISAACSAPTGFSEAVFPFAKATYDFDDGRSLTTTVVRHCRVRDRP